jgi:hypothetical protein
MYTLNLHDKRAHFLAMPRTASKSCRDALRKLGAVTHGGHHDIKMSVVQEGDLVMSSVRNHFDWFVSFWCLNGCPGKFHRYVPKLCRESEWIHRNPDGTRCQLFWRYAPLSNVILRYERIEQDFTQALMSNGFPNVQLPPSTEAKPKHYRAYYHPATVRLIEDKFGEELTRYEYTFD